MIRFFIGIVAFVIFFLGMIVGASFDETTFSILRGLGSLFNWMGS